MHQLLSILTSQDTWLAVFLIAGAAFRGWKASKANQAKDKSENEEVVKLLSGILTELRSQKPGYSYDDTTDLLLALRQTNDKPKNLLEVLKRLIVKK